MYRGLSYFILITSHISGLYLLCFPSKKKGLVKLGGKQIKRTGMIHVLNYLPFVGPIRYLISPLQPIWFKNVIVIWELITCPLSFMFLQWYNFLVYNLMNWKSKNCLTYGQEP